MKKVYSLQKQLKFGSDPWIGASVGWWRYFDPDNPIEHELMAHNREGRMFDNFDELYNYLETQRLPHLSRGKTWLTKTPYVLDSTSWPYRRVTKKNFEKVLGSVAYKISYTEIPNPSMRSLLDKLSADDIVEYCTNIGIKICTNDCCNKVQMLDIIPCDKEVSD